MNAEHSQQQHNRQVVIEAPPPPPPANFYEAIIRGVERFGVVTMGVVVVLCAFGWAVRVIYLDQRATNEARWNDSKVHQIELMAYLSNRNDSDAKRAVADLDLAKSLQALSQAIDRQTNIVERIDRDAHTAHTSPSPSPNPPRK